MKCPHCGKDIDDKIIARHLAGKGGAKSRRTLTKDQAQEMVRIREARKDDTAKLPTKKEGASG